VAVAVARGGLALRLGLAGAPAKPAPQGGWKVAGTCKLAEEPW